MKNLYPWLHDYLGAKPGVERDFKVEWGWTRYRIDKKMFAAVCKNEAGEDWLLTLKLDPAEGELVRAAFQRVFPGYYSDKRHWNSVHLGDMQADWAETCARIRDAAGGGDADGDLPEAVLRGLCDRAYQLGLAKLSKRRRQEILGADAGERRAQ